MSKKKGNKNGEAAEMADFAPNMAPPGNYPEG